MIKEINNLISNAESLYLNKNELFTKLLSLCGEYILYIFISLKYNTDLKEKEYSNLIDLEKAKEKLKYKLDNLTIDTIIGDTEEDKLNAYNSKIYKIKNLNPKLNDFLNYYDEDNNQKKLLGIIISNIDYKIFKTKEDCIEFLNLLVEKLSGGISITKNLADFLKELGYNEKNNVKSVYDNAVGLGNLFDHSKNLKYYGIEIDPTIAKLCQIIMLIHDKDPKSIICGNTIECGINHKEKYDLVFSDMPMGIRFDIKIDKDKDKRFKNVPDTLWKSDGLFIADALYHLNENGICIVNCAQGLLFRPGGEKKFREYLIENNYIEGILYLPKNVLNGAPDAFAIMILRKNKKNDDTIKLFDLSDYYRQTERGKPKEINQEQIKEIINIYYNEEYNEQFNKQFIIVSQFDIMYNDYDLSFSKYKTEDESIKYDFELNKDIIKLLIKLSNKNKDLLNTQLNDLDKIKFE